MPQKKMEESSSQPNQPKSEKKKIVSCLSDFPLGEFNPLIKRCYNHSIRDYEELSDLIFDKMFPLYKQFLGVLNKSYAIVAKNSYREENPPILESRASLRPIKGYLSRSMKRHVPWDFGIYVPYFKSILSACFSEEEIAKFTDKKVKKRYLLWGMFEEAKAYFHWCLSKIADGRRIGAVAYQVNKKPVRFNGDCRIRIPDINGDFYEFETLQRFIPNYDSLKAYSFSERDFLTNAPKQEIGSRLVDMLSDFKQEYGKRNLRLLASMARQINEYGKRLEWNPQEFFEHVGYK